MIKSHQDLYHCAELQKINWPAFPLEKTGGGLGTLRQEYAPGQSCPVQYT